MRIKDSGGHTRFSDHLAAVLRRRRLLVGIVLFVAYSAGMVFLGTVAQQKDLPGKLNRIIPASWKHPGNYIQGIISNPDKITIDIKHKDFKKLAYLRQCALQKGVIATAPDSYVPAKIRLDGKTVKVQVRLKGDIIDHIQGDKWSLRIKVQKNGSVYGMKRFSIQDPKLCSYVNEWILHQLYKHEGLISLRYRFVTVVINGKNKGIYALEENFSKELVEHNERREGPILKFDETHLWDGSRANYGVSNSQADIFFSSNVDTFRTKKTFSDPALRTNYFIAKQLLEDFRAGKIRVSEAFDLPRLAKLYALANLTSSEHALRWKNVRFYYDPITRKLEAIGYNAYTTRMGLGHRRNIIMWHDRYRSRHVVPEYQNLFFQDKDFVRLYMKTLDRISRKEYMDRFFESIASDLKKNMAILYSAYPDLVLSTADFYRNQRNIHGILNPSIPAMAKMQIVKDAGAPSGKRLRLLVANTCFLPIVMDSIRIIGSKVSHPLQGEIVPGKERSKPLRYHEVRVPKDSGVDPAEAAEKGITLTYHLPELDRLLTTTIRSLQVDLSESPLIVSKDWEETLSAHEMFKVNPRNKTITIRPGDWSITGNLALPKGYRVVCSGGTTIDLLNGSTIVSYSPIRFIGTRDKEILIHSTDATGQGLVVINAQ
ncbi:MAG: CotH kinase family protein, partial [Phycisphaerae bacterium]|nr:CotH kinase family protein [Phycisphaerae bacterium]